jgi:hypothetical protein
MAVPYRLRAPRPASAEASGDSLGPTVRIFRQAAQRKVIWAAVPFALLLAYVVWLGHEGLLLKWFNSDFSVWAVSILFVLAIVLIVFTAAVGGPEAVRVHANGISDVRGPTRAMRWDEMHSLVAICGVSGAVLRHVLRGEDGTAVALGPSIGDVEALVDEVRVRMTERKAGLLEARLAAGGTVRFGAIEARPGGLALVSLAGKVLPWADVGQIEAEAGMVVLRSRSGQEWGRAALGEVPNAFLLSEVAERRATQARANE